MDSKELFDEVVDWLQCAAEYFIRREFDDMPSVKFKCGEQKGCLDIAARYHYKPHRVIEFSPGFLASCWKGRKGKYHYWDLGRLQGTLIHELDHAWVDWKDMSSDKFGGHNGIFLWKMHQLKEVRKLRSDLGATFNKWDGTEALYNEVKLGWNPFYIKSLDEWHKFIAAIKDEKSLISNYSMIVKLEKSMPADKWREIIERVMGWNSLIKFYEMIHEAMSSNSRISLVRLSEIIERLESRQMPAYMIFDELKGEPFYMWDEIIEKWHEVLSLIESWSFLSVRQFIETFMIIDTYQWRDTVRILKRWRPVFNFLMRVKERWDYEVMEGQNQKGAFNRSDNFSSVDDEDLYLVAEDNYQSVQRRREMDVYLSFVSSLESI